MADLVDAEVSCLSNGETVKFSSVDHAQKMLANLNNLRQNSTFCDVNIIVGQKKFGAHRALLSASSPYFQAMFTSGLTESLKSEVEIHGIEETVFHLLLDFVYTGHVEIEKCNVQELMVAADMLQLSEVLDACYIFLKKELHFSNCIGIYQFAESSSSRKLQTVAENYINVNFVEVTKEDEFLDIPLNILLTIIGSEHLHIDNELQVFEAAMKWIFHELSERRKHIYQILEKVRLPLISQSHLKSYARNCPDLILKMAMNKLFDESRPTIGTDGSPLPNSAIQPRACGRKKIFIIGGYNREIGMRWSESCTLTTVLCFDVAKDIWSTLRPMLVARSGHGVATSCGLIYAIGGESDDSMIFSHGEVYDPAEERWEPLPSMTSPRTLLGVCAVDGLIYALGGWVGCYLGNSIEMYDPEQKTWTDYGLMMTPRCAAGVITHQGLVYVVGGLSDMLTEMDLVESYDPVTREWNKLAPMRVKRAYVGVAVVQGYLYAIGGVAGIEKVLNSAERYCFQDNRWEDIPPMTSARGSACIASVNGCVFAVGGRTSSDEFSPATTLNTIECYNPQKNEWRDIANIPASCCEAGVVVF